MYVLIKYKAKAIFKRKIVVFSHGVFYLFLRI